MTDHGHHAHDDHGHDDHAHHGLAPGQNPHESPLVVTIPLILLAIPSVIIGFYTIDPLLFGSFFGDSIFIDIAKHPVMKDLAQGFPWAGCHGDACIQYTGIFARGLGRTHCCDWLFVGA
jgi:NADH:ubiquinone oxidoreductase subunit 5 (subunit L)/multisubunit Na+/H+ antiporter MnhA subunit